MLWPVVLYFHGLYQVKRGRSRIDEFFAILFSVLIASALTLGVTLYVRVYYFYQPEVAPLWEYSQAVFALFIVARRAGAERRAAGRCAPGWSACGPPASTSGACWSRARASSARRWPRRSSPIASWAIASSASSTTTPTRAGHGGLPVLGTLDQTMDGARRATRVDQLYVALPLEEHAKLLR